MLSNDDQTIVYRNVAITCESFRFLINYFVLRPNPVKCLSLLALPQTSSNIKGFKTFIIKEANQKDSLVFEGSPFIKLMKIIIMLRQAQETEMIPNVALFQVSNEIPDPDSIIQIFLKNYHKENLDVIRMMSIESFDINSEENGIYLLSIAKAKEAFKANKKNFFIVYFTKMGEMKTSNEEFVNYCIKEFQGIKNVIVVLTNVVNPAEKPTKNIKFNESIWNINLKMNLKRLKTLIKDFVF